MYVAQAVNAGSKKKKAKNAICVYIGFLNAKLTKNLQSTCHPGGLL